jgi:hypothetical protein
LWEKALEIQLKSLSGKNIATGATEDCQKYLVLCDSKIVGVIHYRHTKNVAFTKPIDPLKKQQIVEEVARILDVTSLESYEVPVIPEELASKEQGEEFYEFDEEDAAGEGSD